MEISVSVLIEITFIENIRQLILQILLGIQFYKLLV